MAPVHRNRGNPIIIPGLSTKNSHDLAGKLLRRPLPPRVLPPLTTNKDNEQESDEDRSHKVSLIEMFQAIFDLDALRNADAVSDISTDRGSAEASSACPPPPPAGTFVMTTSNGFSHGQDPQPINIHHQDMSFEGSDFFITCNDMKYILDPVSRRPTCSGKYTDGKRLLRSLKHRGPDPLPCRPPRKNPEILVMDDDDERYCQPPAFMLEHFMHKLVEKKSPQAEHAIYSRQNFKKFTDLLAQELYQGGQATVHTQNLDSSGIPLKENRVPQRQLIYEMAALLKAHIQELTGTDVKSVIKPLPKYNPDYAGEAQPHTRIIFYADETMERVNEAVRAEQETEMPGINAVFYSASSRYFQGSRRSGSPVAVPEEGSISPSELAVLESLLTGGTTLSFKAHFIDELPDITLFRTTLTHLNLCFNNFQNVPPEVLDLTNLEILKMRNNPLLEIPADINRLKKLRVFIASFCLIASLPKTLFDISCLEELSVAYNKLTFMPSDLCRLKSLQLLDIEGNQIPALPVTCLTMEKLAQVNVRNNFMHPLFWHENTKNNIVQSLLDLACVGVVRAIRSKDLQHVPNEAAKILAREEMCDVCKGPLFGPGLRTIRPMSKLFSVKNVPLMFRACTPGCFQRFKNMTTEELRIMLYSGCN